jgi:hypothetical protein
LISEHRNRNAFEVDLPQGRTSIKFAKYGSTALNGPPRDTTEVDIPKVQQEPSPLFVPSETIGKGKLVHDLFIFTDHSVILINKQGLPSPASRRPAKANQTQT